VELSLLEESCEGSENHYPVTVRWAGDVENASVSVCFSARQTQAKSQWIGASVIVDKLGTQGAVTSKRRRWCLSKRKMHVVELYNVQ
jgi:predicted ATP-dependent Lon-type protease